MYPEYEDDLKLFELSENASLAALKTSYQELLKVWHPDKFPNDEKLKKRATSKLIEIKDAHERLSTCFKFRDQQKRKSRKASAKKKSVKPPPVLNLNPIAGIVIVGIVVVISFIVHFATIFGTPDSATAGAYRLIPALEAMDRDSSWAGITVDVVLLVGIILTYINHPNGKRIVRVGCYLVCLLSVLNWFSYYNLKYDPNFIRVNQLYGGAASKDFSGAFYWFKLFFVASFWWGLTYFFRVPGDYMDRLVCEIRSHLEGVRRTSASTPKSERPKPTKPSLALLTTTTKPRTKKSKKTPAPYTPPRVKSPRKTKAQKQKEKEQHAFDVSVILGSVFVFAIVVVFAIASSPANKTSSSSKSQSAASETLAKPLVITDDDIYDGNVDAVKRYLNNGGDPHRKSEDGESTLVNLAVANGKLEIAQLFIDSGVDVNLSDQDSWTLLHSAASNGHLEIVDYLIIEGISVNAVDKYNSSPVNEAAKHRQALAGLALMQANANPNIVDEYGAFTLTYLMNHVEIQSGFKSKRRLKTDMEKFFIACLKNGANPNILNYKTKLSCLDLAYKMKNEGLAEVLKFYGGKESKNSPYTRKGIKGFFNRLKD